jgi:tRNA (cytidine/uridine-2'-O-)-methyltransferase
MCALTRSRLHLIHPLGYVINDRNLRRAGMDYWKQLDVHEHADWAAFRASAHAPKRLWLFTTKAEQDFWHVSFADEDGLVFGNESSGAPDWLHAELHATRVTIPHANPTLRSLNLSTAAGVATYEALRQVGLPSPQRDFALRWTRVPLARAGGRLREKPFAAKRVPKRAAGGRLTCVRQGTS